MFDELEPVSFWVLGVAYPRPAGGCVPVLGAGNESDAVAAEAGVPVFESLDVEANVSGAKLVSVQMASRTGRFDEMDDLELVVPLWSSHEDELSTCSWYASVVASLWRYAIYFPHDLEPHRIAIEAHHFF